MKKCTFYSQVLNNNKIVAQLQNGYSDGYFNYYCHTYNNGSKTWFAIEPSTGLSITTGNTRKEAQQKATTPEMFKRVNEKITQNMIQRFFELKIEAETA